MNTRELIENVKRAQASFDVAKADLAKAGQALLAAQDAFEAASQALHDDLEQNGPALYVDQSADPVEYVIYAAEGTDSFTATPIRPAA